LLFYKVDFLVMDTSLLKSKAMSSDG